MSLSECLLIGLVAILVIKPEEWPKVIRFFASLVTPIRGWASELKSHADALIKQADLIDREQQAEKVDQSYSRKED